METNLVLKAEDLTQDFADGIRKLFSNNATLYIRVEYGETGSQSAGRGRPAKAASTESAEAPKKRGRKPGSTNKKAASGAEGGPKKRGRKPKSQPAE